MDFAPTLTLVPGKLITIVKHGTYEGRFDTLEGALAKVTYIFGLNTNLPVTMEQQVSSDGVAVLIQPGQSVSPTPAIVIDINAAVRAGSLSKLTRFLEQLQFQATQIDIHAQMRESFIVLRGVHAGLLSFLLEPWHQLQLPLYLADDTAAEKFAEKNPQRVGTIWLELTF